MTANVVIEMGYATGIHREALIATGVVLFVFILLINLLFSVIKREGEIMSEVDGVKAINKVTFGQRLKAYKRSKLSFLLAVLVLLSADYYDWRAGLPDILYFD